MQRMTDAQRTLVEKNMPMVTWVLQNRIPYWRKDEYEDLFQAGALGLCKAAMRYDESTGVRFSTCACSYIFGEIRNENRRLRRQEIRAGMARLQGAVGMDEITMLDQKADVEDGQTMERMLILKETMNRIRGRDRKALDLHIAGYGQAEIGRRMNMTQSSASRSLRRARKLIADEYAR